MRDRDEFERCAEIVRRGCWSWFLTMKFPRVVSPKYPAIRCEGAEEAFMVWIGEANGVYGRDLGNLPSHMFGSSKKRRRVTCYSMCSWMGFQSRCKVFGGAAGGS